jgi:hypothetical protein
MVKRCGEVLEIEGEIFKEEERKKVRVPKKKILTFCIW